MTYDEVIEHFGSGYKIAKQCGFSTSTPYHWKRQGFIPIESQMKIERMTKGKLRAEIKHYENELDVSK